MLRRFSELVFIGVFLIATSQCALADSEQKDSVEMHKFSLRKPRKPLIAGGLSLILPGAGQFYNGGNQYWKTSYLVGIGLLLLAVDFNNTRYLRFREGYNLYVREGPEAKQKADPSVQVFFEYKDSLNLQRGRDFYLSQRDFWAVLTIVGWTINVIDAMVYAHLSGFNISEKVKLFIRPKIPSYTDLAYGTSYGGVSLTLKF